MHYISFKSLSDRLEEDYIYNDLWENLDDKDKQRIYKSIHRVVDNDFNYVGIGTGSRLFPRDFDLILSSPNYNLSIKNFLRKYNKSTQTTSELQDNLVNLAKDLLQLSTLRDAISMKDKLRASSISGIGSNISMDTGLPKSNIYTNNSVSFIRKFWVSTIASFNQTNDNFFERQNSFNTI